MNKVILILIGLVSVLACTDKKKSEGSMLLRNLPSPADSLSAEPHLFTDSRGDVYLSWVARKNDTSLFLFSRLKEDQWSEPSLIAQGTSWFVNWADYPMLAADGAGNMIAHILEKSSKGTYAYDVKMYASADEGKTWSDPFTLNDDGKPAEHGFVTMLPFDGKVFATWLDGRNTVMEGMEDMEGMDHEGHHGAMSLRASILDYSGKKTNEWELDNKTCDCCQTTAAITDNGPVVIYRDRSDEEVRDMSIVRLINGQWTEPKSIHPDNWKIAGCPVNGPRVAADGNNLAVAWFSAATDTSQVNVVFSTDGGATFGQPIRMDEGKAIGRVDIVLMNNNTAIVSWMEGSLFKAAKIHTDGTKEPSVTVAPSSESRSSGFPQMTKSGNQLIFAWTDDNERTIKVASISL